jgi:hypothetical protein
MLKRNLDWKCVSSVSHLYRGCCKIKPTMFWKRCQRLGHLVFDFIEMKMALLLLLNFIIDYRPRLFTEWSRFPKVIFSVDIINIRDALVHYRNWFLAWSKSFLYILALFWLLTTRMNSDSATMYFTCGHNQLLNSLFPTCGRSRDTLSISSCYRLVNSQSWWRCQLSVRSAVSCLFRLEGFYTDDAIIRYTSRCGR